MLAVALVLASQRLAGTAAAVAALAFRNPAVPLVAAFRVAAGTAVLALRPVAGTGADAPAGARRNEAVGLAVAVQAVRPVRSIVQRVPVAARILAAA